LKNPAAFNDDFWKMFLNIFIKSCSFLFQSVWHLTAKRQPIGFYICTGTNPLVDDPNPVKVWGIVELLSVVLHIIIIVRIQLFKRQRVIGPETRSNFLKGLFLGDIETEALLTFTTNVVTLFFMCLTAFNVAVINRIEPNSLNSFPYDHLFYFAFFITPILFCGLSVLLYYHSNKALKKAAKNFIVDAFYRIAEFFKCHTSCNLPAVVD
jgi:hypothetical protein